MQSEITVQKLFTALSNREFVLHYQPLMDTDSGGLSGVESLLRWQHPASKSVVLASKLVPFLMQDDSLAVALDDWAVCEALTQGGEWQQQGLAFGSIAVNLLSWYRGDAFVAMITKALSTTALHPGLLALEAHDAVLSAGPLGVLTRVMHELARQGVLLAIDNFSWSPAHIEKVMQLPVQFVKVKAEQWAVLMASDRAAMVKKEIRMLQKSGIRVVAVGVESADKQMEHYKSGIRLFQGNFYKSPLTAKQLTSLLDLVQRTTQAYQL
ncbi:MAG: EAL domain-containing protein [Magnetococcales bacterium]|nr:EAL domain-containing protein [Magnetococcales bacterium]